MTENPGNMRDAAERIRDCIGRYVASGENNLYPGGVHEPAWNEPLVGFSRGDDPLYQGFKDDIGPFYWTPPEIFAATFPDVRVKPDELTVISWVLPQTEQTRRDNGREKAVSAERWARARKYGEEFNVKLRDHVAGFLREAGHEAVAPMNAPLFRWEKSARYGFASSWSERHTAYASGLGTFGAVRRPDHVPGKGDALRFRGGPDRRPSVGASLHRSPRLLPFPFQRELRQMHQALPGGRHHPGGARQGKVLFLRPPRIGPIHPGPVRFRHVRLRPLPDRRPLRGEDPRPRTNRVTSRK